MEELQSLKVQIHQHSLELLSNRIEESEFRLKETQESFLNETKGSAGDKHETAREMARQELEKVEANHSILLNSLEQLRRLDPSVLHDKVGLGSLVKTESTLFYLSVPIGAIQLNSSQVFCLSASAPLARTMIGLSAKERFTFNGKTQQIIQVS